MICFVLGPCNKMLESKMMGQWCWTQGCDISLVFQLCPIHFLQGPEHQLSTLSSNSIVSFTSSKQNSSAIWTCRSSTQSQGSPTELTDV
jgi:hypothetical protein